VWGRARLRAAAYPPIVVWWMVGALLVAAVVILGLAVRPVLMRLGALRRAARALREREAQALALRQAAEALSERAALLGEQADAASRRMTKIKMHPD
jgi:flagellar biosynthesis/type III secretory pathway M-ring protein FliF/YscJ